eukprot:CAMPEP_0206491566 /NCGR_PEP_ID=MMETSP0324_2-20121206/45147_1 /ASSEMBLY_ACC=CAM_ASM_000836 /TAXON_ID=2866 /ORGANISM="Crypthecodinium cohnii, Strain Seligo" /LENGTH=42 /DNA_ID= /DNA_START= /DNA_END= /DNA_ORIENTATION=
MACHSRGQRLLSRADQVGDEEGHGPWAMSGPPEFWKLWTPMG